MNFKEKNLFIIANIRADLLLYKFYVENNMIQDAENSLERAVVKFDKMVELRLENEKDNTKTMPSFGRIIQKAA